MAVSCIVLAGGKSTRLGRSKVTESVGQQSLLERVISRLAPLRTEVLVVTARESSIPALTSFPQVRQVADIVPAKGSLGGIFTGLSFSKTFYNLVVAGDMPLLNKGVLEYLIELAKATGADVVIPRLNGVLEPLHAVYSKNCLPPMERLITENRLSILEVYPMVKVKYVERSEIGTLDDKLLSFFNINTEEDLELGRELVRKEDLKHDKR